MIAKERILEYINSLETTPSSIPAYKLLKSNDTVENAINIINEILKLTKEDILLERKAVILQGQEVPRLCVGCMEELPKLNDKEEVIYGFSPGSKFESWRNN